MARVLAARRAAMGGCALASPVARRGREQLGRRQHPLERLGGQRHLVARGVRYRAHAGVT